jgi:glycosyltransferase involved in cell wall biosynthesis
MHKDLLADAMVSMCLNKGMRLRMGESGRLRAEKYYTQKIMMDKYRSLYEEVVKK